MPAIPTGQAPVSSQKLPCAIGPPLPAPHPGTTGTASSQKESPSGRVSALPRCHVPKRHVGLKGPWRNRWANGFLDPGSPRFTPCGAAPHPANGAQAAEVRKLQQPVGGAVSMRANLLELMRHHVTNGNKPQQGSPRSNQHALRVYISQHCRAALCM